MTRPRKSARLTKKQTPTQRAPKETVEKYLSQAQQDSGVLVPFTANSLPPEIISKIYGYIEDYEKPLSLICNLALVCKNFYEYFSKPVFWQEYPKEDGFLLLQNTVKRNIWDSEQLNNWYTSLFVEDGVYLDYMSCASEVLPSEIWLHRKLLIHVLEYLDGYLTCAPSREDFKPYANDSVVAQLFLRCMATSECFAYLSDELRDTESIVLAVIKRFPSAITHCSTSLLNNREFIKRVVSVNGECLRYLGDYRSDTELVIAASRTSPAALDMAHGQAYFDILRVALARCPEAPKVGEACGTCGKTRGR